MTDGDGEDVGLMYVPIAEYVDYYERFQDGDNWYDEYVQPPLTFHGRNLEQASGFWRRIGGQARD